MGKPSQMAVRKYLLHEDSRNQEAVSDSHFALDESEKVSSLQEP